MLTDINYSAVEYLCMKMRDCDRREIFALRPHNSDLQLAADAFSLIRNTGRGRIAWHKGLPAGCAAFTENWAGCWEIWMFGTDEFKSVVVELVRWFRKEANEILTVCEGRRLQCDSSADHHEAHKLIKAAGGIEEARFEAYGKNGEDFIRFVWLNGKNDAILRPHYTRAA